MTPLRYELRSSRTGNGSKASTWPTGQSETVPALGRFVIQPLVTMEYVEEYGRWADEWLVQWTLETIDGIPEHPVTPPPPPYPEARYRLSVEDGELVGRLDRA